MVDAIARSLSDDAASVLSEVTLVPVTGGLPDVFGNAPSPLGSALPDVPMDDVLPHDLPGSTGAGLVLSTAASESLDLLAPVPQLTGMFWSPYVCAPVLTDCLL